MQWSNKWQLKVHPEKCRILKLGHDREMEYFMNSKDKDGNPIRVNLKETQAERDLWVTIDKVLSFRWHVAHSASKANHVCGVIRRSFDYLTPAIFIQLFRGLESGHSRSTVIVCGTQTRRIRKVSALRWKTSRGGQLKCWALWRTFRTPNGYISWSFHIWNTGERGGT